MGRSEEEVEGFIWETRYCTTWCGVVAVGAGIRRDVSKFTPTPCSLSLSSFLELQWRQGLVCPVLPSVDFPPPVFG